MISDSGAFRPSSPAAKDVPVDSQAADRNKKTNNQIFFITIPPLVFGMNKCQTPVGLSVTVGNRSEKSR
jgi:hypothetical protein